MSNRKLGQQQRHESINNKYLPTINIDKSSLYNTNFHKLNSFIIRFYSTYYLAHAF